MLQLKMLTMGIFLTASLLGFSTTAAAKTPSRRVASVSAEKRWTLSDWLSQKDRSRMMDLWLAFNSPSPFEFMLGGSYSSYIRKTDTPPDKTFSSSSGEFSAHAQIFGLTGEYENNVKESFNDVTGIFNLRVFGNSIQSSYLTFNYGLRTRTLGANSDLNTTTHEIMLRQQFGQASLQMYIHKYFGIDGFYRQYMPSEDQDLGKLNGTATEGGVFIDFGSLRVFGRWFEEKNIAVAPADTVESNTRRTGVKTGFKFFF